MPLSLMISFVLLVNLGLRTAGGSPMVSTVGALVVFGEWKRSSHAGDQSLVITRTR